MSAVLSLGAGLVMVGAPAVNASAETSQGENLIDRPAGSLTADALPTVQINKGVVWDQVIVGDTVYAGGAFAHVRPYGAAPDTQIEPRKNLMAYSLTTGRHTTWRPAANGGVSAIAVNPSKTRLYIGGKFTTIDGQSHSRIAAFELPSGKLVNEFAPSVDAEVSAIEATDSTVYIGGFFSSVNGVSRQRLAALDSNGNLTGWAPTADSYVRGMALTNDGSRLVIGGSFSYVNGVYASGMGSLDPVTGALQSWSANQVIRNGGTYAGIYSLRNDGKNIVAAGWSQIANRGFEGVASMDQSTGQIRWMADCHGDSYDTATIGDVVYDASHHHNCANIGYMPEQTPEIAQRLNAWTDKATGTVQHNKQANYADFYGNPAPSAIAWWPELNAGTFTGMYQAAWSLAANDKYMVVGGEFTSVNGQLQQGLARFAVDSVAPKKMGPRHSDDTPTVTVSGQQAKISWRANSDWDGAALHYDLVRVNPDGSTEVVGSLDQETTWWNRPDLTITDVTAEENTSYQYFVRSKDADGNVRESAKVQVTTGSGPAATSGGYAEAVVADKPMHYWRMDEPAGSSTVADQVGNSPLRVLSGVSLGGDSANPALGTSMAVNGTLSSYAYTPKYETNTLDVTVEAWVKTTTTTGGKIAGLGTSTGTLSMYTDRNLYLTNSGRVAWGIDDGWGNKAILSDVRVNDGTWHHIAGVLGESGMKLYVDGRLSNQNSNVTQSDQVTGYWHVGCDATALWPSAPSTRCLTGAIDEVAVYSSALSAEALAKHVAAARPNSGPTASFTASCDDQGLCTLDGSASSDADGKVVAWKWKFDDGATATGVNATHTFTTPGEHTITLTTYDDDGASDTASRTVTVTVPEGTEKVLAKDSFSTVRSQWGSAEVGGKYGYMSAGSFTTDGSRGLITATKGVTAKATLAGVQMLDGTVSADVTIDQLTTGGGLYTRLDARQNGDNNYWGYVRWRADGTATMTVSKRVAGVQTDLKSIALPEGYEAGTTYRLSLSTVTQADGSTLVTATAQKSGSATVTTVEASDSTPALAVAGAPAVSTYLSGSATSPVKVFVDNLEVKKN